MSNALRSDLDRFVKTGSKQKLKDRQDYVYPELRVSYTHQDPIPPISSAYGKFSQPGCYACSITQPDLFYPYLKEQLSILSESYTIQLEVGLGKSRIPYYFVLKTEDKIRLGKTKPDILAHHFPYANLRRINDHIINGRDEKRYDGRLPLSLFEAERTDYSLQRIQHYTGTAFRDVQHYILFTNYHRYINRFIDWAMSQLYDGSFYHSLSLPGFIEITSETKNARKLIEESPWHRFQMPAYHLKAKNNVGISLINIGVGPSNAKTITDHLAVLRPHCWLMIGHCGGLRHSQRLGDYVLAHAYLRKDHVLDTILPIEIPIPPIAEIQQALVQSVSEITGKSDSALKHRVRTGTIVTQASRNWELDYQTEALVFNQSRAIATDMESATIAANGFRYRVPYGTLLCVSDKPLHGEIKLPGSAMEFYDQSIAEHMRIGIRTIEILRKNGREVHSRKLRAFNEPPFR